MRFAVYHEAPAYPGRLPPLSGVRKQVLHRFIHIEAAGRWLSAGHGLPLTTNTAHVDGSSPLFSNLVGEGSNETGERNPADRLNKTASMFPEMLDD